MEIKRRNGSTFVVIEKVQKKKFSTGSEEQWQSLLSGDYAEVDAYGHSV